MDPVSPQLLEVEETFFHEVKSEPDIKEEEIPGPEIEDYNGIEVKIEGKEYLPFYSWFDNITGLYRP